ncbi:hypothetical protein [Umezawaea sp. Da 62-37]|uniref:hypothetical protein n=1 Tax=Umezawaea sp. Da 62-37 TaxID=3075927 RepID=UPI0028F74CEB|nr:hypothetical protein [Umezawaea sp. Da 62-37]WNV84879.1 hypothetical protein RM788_43090 [Umezawaea sp. Da 62-37]
MDDTPLQVASVSASTWRDGVDDVVVRALTYPAAPVEGSKARMRTVDLGDLRVALGTGALRFALSLMDGSGRISGRSVFEYLRWSAGERLVGSLGKSYLVLRPDVEGTVSLDGRKRLCLPPGMLRYCGIAHGGQALLIAEPQHRMLIVHSMANLAHMARAYHSEQFEQALRRGM